MKHLQFLSLALLGLLLMGSAQAQEDMMAVQTMAEPTAMMTEEGAEPMPMMAEVKEMKMHEECGAKKKGGCGSEKGECPMKKMMREHHGGSMFLMKALCAAGMLVFLFLGAFVVRKGWEFKGFCKKCKK